MTLKPLFWPLVLLTSLGCGSVAPPVGSAYTPAAPGTPTSTVLEGATPPSAPPPGVSEIDVVVAREVRRTLNHDWRLAAASRGVRVKCEKGVVTLRGSVRTVQDREAIAHRVEQVPCVDRVNDALSVNP